MPGTPVPAADGWSTMLCREDEVIHRGARVMGEAASGAALRERLNRHLDELPMLPGVVSRLMALDPSAEDHFEEVVQLVESEPNFAARLLVAANSVVSGPRFPITNLRAAVARMGSRSASQLVLSLSITRVFVPQSLWEKSLWRHALQVALAARALTPYCGGPAILADEAYTVALLHDVGRFVMFREAPDQLRRVDEGDWDSPDELIREERSLCGLTHTEIGAMACEKWHLPDTITRVVRDHHLTPARQDADPVARLTALIRLADIAMFPSAMPGTPGLGEADQESVWRVLGPKLPPFVSILPDELRILVRTVTADAEAICRSLGIG